MFSAVGAAMFSALLLALLLALLATAPTITHTAMPSLDPRPRRLLRVTLVGLVLAGVAGTGLVLADWRTANEAAAGSAGSASAGAAVDGQSAGTAQADLDLPNADGAPGSALNPVPAQSSDPGLDPAGGTSLMAGISQQSFIDATLNVANAYNGVARGTQPNLSALSLYAADMYPIDVDEAWPDPIPTSAAIAAAIAADNEAISQGARSIPGATGRLALLVEFPSRLDHSIDEAWEAQHELLLNAALEQADVCVVGSCDTLVGQLTPSFEPPANGEYERVAPQRTADTYVTRTTYLTAAFELALWRPIGLHPAAADIYRQVAADTRIKSSAAAGAESAGAGAESATAGTAGATAASRCDISALWIAAAIESELVTQGAIDYGVIHLTSAENNGHIADIGSLARHVARKGCAVASTGARTGAQDADDGLEPFNLTSSTPFWNKHDTAQISDRISPDVNPTLSRWRTYDAELVGSFRACDDAESIIDRADTVNVRGFEIHPCLSESLGLLLEAARADGIYLSGGGWRSTTQQIRLRISNCQLPSRSAANYRIELSLAPSTICQPQTAPPGRSRHNAGLAVDFVCGASNQALTGGRCYRWAASNAHKFGFYNLLSEPWHWSTDGR